ncbi:hypothetical protein [Deinococcus aquiradiocola]|uniref:Uncharacterized protein n=1 Tax=Deinococcus aquiradiocola TaxID=393059 RepID=A0A917UVN5_9DEIO|nr:hypothetical protein [Deinococcus aquiradiocola]GGJ88087.1 hypothetical protein GCM10008939_35160 [Deinococcus aquiradiocola]
MNSFTVRRVHGVAIHHPQPLAVVSATPGVGELCRTQTPEKADRVLRALALLERYERGELVDLAPTADHAPALTLIASD